MNYPTHNLKWAASPIGDTRNQKNDVGILTGLNSTINENSALSRDGYLQKCNASEPEAMYIAEFFNQDDDSNIDGSAELWMRR